MRLLFGLIEITRIHKEPGQPITMDNCPHQELESIGGRSYECQKCRGIGMYYDGRFIVPTLNNLDEVIQYD